MMLSKPRNIVPDVLAETTLPWSLTSSSTPRWPSTRVTGETVIRFDMVASSA
jgi:hypothetical protein